MLPWDVPDDKNSFAPDDFPANMVGGHTVCLLLLLKDSTRGREGKTHVGNARILGCGSDRLKPSFILHNTPLNQGLCAIHNVTIFASFFDVAYPFLFKSFEKAPETIGDIQKGDVVAWDYSLLVVSSHFSLNSSAISVPTENTTDSLLTRAAINLKLSLSDIKTIRIFVDPENIKSLSLESEN